MVRRAWPVRTCVGCRKRAPSSELLRLVAVGRGDGVTVVEPDPGRRRPGRGAHLHPDPACLALAERRRALGRALRITGVLDTGPLVEHLDALGDSSGSPRGVSRAGPEESSAVGGGASPTRISKVGRPT